jgi:predicted ATP-grasp superfamily ATP-dependent carboligase
VRPARSARGPILVTDAESRKALALVRSLGRSHAVLASSEQRLAMAGWSRQAAGRLRQPPPEVVGSWALETVRTHGLHAIFAPQEPTILALADRYDELQAAGTILTFPRPEILANAFDKRRTLAVARTVGMPIPASIETAPGDDLERAAAEIGYPVVLKAPRSYERRGIATVRLGGPWYASTAEELRAIIRDRASDDPPPIVQRFVHGTGIGYSVLLDRDGELCAEFAHRRVRDIDPRGSASVVREAIPIDPDLRDLSLRLLREMGWWGVAMVEFKLNQRTGELALMEVNGRFWGSLQLAIDSGVDLPTLLLSVVEGGRPSVPLPTPGRRLRWWLGDAASTARVMKGPPRGFPGTFPARWSAVKTFLRPSRGTRNEVLRASDPLPALMEVLGLLRRIRHR